MRARPATFDFIFDARIALSFPTVSHAMGIRAISVERKASKIVAARRKRQQKLLFECLSGFTLLYTFSIGSHQFPIALPNLYP